MILVALGASLANKAVCRSRIADADQRTDDCVERQGEDVDSQFFRAHPARQQDLIEKGNRSARERASEDERRAANQRNGFAARHGSARF